VLLVWCHLLTDFKEFLKIIKTDEVSQKLQSCKLNFYFHFKINERAETYRITEQDRATLNNFLFNFFRDKSQQYCRI